MIFNFLLIAIAFSLGSDEHVQDADKVFPYIDSDCDTLNGETYLRHFEFKEPLNNCVDIRDSIFVEVTVAKGHGGAILFDNNALNATLSIIQCSFTKCVSEEGHGGAIESNARAANILYNCGSQCSAFVSGQFVYLHKVDNSEVSINVTTVVSSSSETGDSPIDNYVNTASMYQINTSSCALKDPKSTGSFKLNTKNLFLRECSFFNITSCYILTLNTYDCNNDIRRLNVVKNAASSGIIFFNGHWSVCEAIFAENTGNYAASVGSSTLLLLSCVFDVDVSLPGNVNTDNCRFNEKTSTYKIGLLDTLLCGAEVSASPYVPPDDGEDGKDGDDDVWKNKGVIGALTGGVIGALVLGVVIGALVICFLKREKPNDHLRMTSNPLLSSQEK